MAVKKTRREEEVKEGENIKPKKIGEGTVPFLRRADSPETEEEGNGETGEGSWAGGALSLSSVLRTCLRNWAGAAVGLEPPSLEEWLVIWILKPSPPPVDNGRRRKGCTEKNEKNFCSAGERSAASFVVR